MTAWRFAVDRGGTFTDIVARDPAIVRAMELWQLERPGWATALVVAHEVMNRMLLADVIGAPLGASAGFVALLRTAVGESEGIDVVWAEE